MGERLIKHHPGRRYDLFFGNPLLYHDEMNEAGECNVAWDFGQVRMKKIRPYEFMCQHFNNRPWRMYVIGNWVTYEQDHTCGRDEYLGVYPSWDFTQFNLRELADYIEHPWSSSYDLSDPERRWIDKPSPTQPHRVFVVNALAGKPNSRDRQKLRKLRDIQLAYPEVEIVLYPKAVNYGALFGMGFTAGVADVRHFIKLRSGDVINANGSCVPVSRQEEFADQFTQFGFKPSDMNASNRVLYMLYTARYAAHHWDDPTGPCLDISKRQKRHADWINPTAYAGYPTPENFARFNPDKVEPTDKIDCNTCSLWRKCPSYRSEAVCNLPSSETRKLADMALSRDAGVITDMLASIVSKQAERADKALQDESFDREGKINPEIDKMLNSVFKNGVMLAKLRNPNLMRPQVQVNVNGVPQITAGQVVAEADARALAAQVILEIEDTGVPRDQITDDMILSHIQNHYAQAQISQSAIDAETVD